MSRHRRRRPKSFDLDAAVAALRARNGPPGDPTFWIRSLRLGSGSLKDPYSEHTGIFGAVTTIVNYLVSVQATLLRGTGEDARLIDSGPWYDFLSRLNPEFTQRETMQMTWTNWMTGGEVMWVLYGRNDLVDENEVPVEAQVFPGSRFEDVVENGILSGWKFTTGNGRQVTLDPWQVLNFRFPDPNKPRRGMSPLSPLLRSLRIDDMAARYNEAFLSNDATPAGILKSDQDVQPKQAETAGSRWRDMHGGPNKSGKIAVMGSGLTYQAIGASHKEMQFLEQREWVRKEIAETLHVPPMLMGDMREVHSKESARTIRKLFWEGVLIPLLVTFESTINERLIQSRRDGADLRIAHDLSDVEALQEEQGARRDSATKDIAMGFPRNEVNVRHQLGYEDQGPSGDVGTIPFSLQPVDAVLELPDSGLSSDTSTDEGGRSIRRSPDRSRMWRAYVNTVLRGPEKAMRTAIRRQVFKVYRANTLAMVDDLYEGERDLTDQSIDAWLAEQEERWDELMVDKTKPSTLQAIENTLARTSDQLGGLQTMDMTHPAVLEVMKNSGGRKIKAVDTVQKGIRGTLLQGMAANENLTSLQSRIRVLFNQYDASGSLRIARTETAAASTETKFETFRVEGVERHSWLTAGDEAVSDGTDGGRNHMALEEETVQVGAVFSNGLKYPLDPAGPAHEVINCRCEALPEV